MVGLLVNLEAGKISNFVTNRTGPGGRLLLKLEKRRCVETLIVGTHCSATGNLNAEGR